MVQVINPLAHIARKLQIYAADGKSSLQSRGYAVNVAYVGKVICMRIEDPTGTLPARMAYDATMYCGRLLNGEGHTKIVRPTHGLEYKLKGAIANWEIV